MKHWLNYSDLVVAFAGGVIRSGWDLGSRLVPHFEERVNLFARHIEGIWPPAISPKVSLIEVDVDHFKTFVRHFLKSECADWGLPNGPNFDLDGTTLDVLQELRRNINEFEGRTVVSA